MKFLFAGTPSDALPRDLTRLGHEAIASHRADWWAQMHAGASPTEYADMLWREVKTHKPDCLFLHKGWHAWHDVPYLWAVPHELLWALRERVGTIVLGCFDDPAASPITIQTGMAAPCDLWLTSCPGIREMVAEHAPTVRVEEFWLAWDEDIAPSIDPELAVDVAITGTPYYKPFPPPHYQYGFRTVRRELAHAVLARNLRLGLWGPETWLHAGQGGDPQLGAWYRGWLDSSRIHVVHGSATATICTHLVEGYRYESGRLWVMGAGGVLVHEDRPGLRDDFDDCALWFPPGDLETAVNQAERVVADPLLRQELSTKGRERVLQKHCWKHRAQRLVELVGEVLRN